MSTNKRETFLRVVVTESRARDTEGMIRTRLRDESTGKDYVQVGYGYDMIGTVLGMWMNDVLGAELTELGRTSYDKEEYASPYERPSGGLTHMLYGDLYGLAYDENVGNAWVNGACGRGSMRAIIGALKHTVREVHRRSTLDGETYYLLEGFAIDESEEG